MNALPTVGGPARWEPPQRFSAVKPQLPQVKLQHNRQETGDCGNLPDTEEKHPPCQAGLISGQALVEPLNHEFNRIIVCVPGGQVLLLPLSRVLSGRHRRLHSTDPQALHTSTGAERAGFGTRPNPAPASSPSPFSAGKHPGDATPS